MIGQLIRKEIRLHLVNVSFSVVLIALWGLAYAVSSTSRDRGELFQIMHYFVIVPGLLFFLPMQMGADSVASERNNHVLERQLSLPFPRYLQWGVKMGVAAILAFVFCGSLVLFIDYELARYLSANHFNLLKIGESCRWPSMTILLFTALGFYASSISNDSLSAFTLAVFVFFLSLLFVYLVTHHSRPIFAILLGDHTPWINRNYSLLNVNSTSHFNLSNRSSLIDQFLFYLRISVLSFALVGMGYTNYRLHGFRFQRVVLHGAIWITLLMVLAVLNW